MTSNEIDDVPTYTIIQGDGLYPDDVIEQEIFAPSKDDKPYRVNYSQVNLYPLGAAAPKPWSSIDESLRAKVDGIALLKLTFTAEDVALFPNLKVIVRMGVGYDGVNRAALAANNILLSNVPDYGTCEVADHALALVLSLRRGIALYNDTQRHNPPATWSRIESPLISRIAGTTFGILGLGRIGTAAALRAKAFGWNVLFYDPGTAMGVERSLGIQRTRDIRELFARSSVVSVHCLLTATTRNMVGYELLSLMPRGGILVNTARGEVVDLDGVERCLREDKLAGFALDVVPEEPIPEDRVHALIRAYRRKEEWLEGRMVLTPHSAWHCPESLVDIRVKSAETMRDVLIKGLRTNVITSDMD